MIFQEVILPNTITVYQEQFKLLGFVYYLNCLDTLIARSRYKLETTLVKEGNLPQRCRNITQQPRQVLKCNQPTLDKLKSENGMLNESNETFLFYSYFTFVCLLFDCLLFDIKWLSCYSAHTVDSNFHPVCCKNF